MVMVLVKMNRSPFGAFVKRWWMYVPLYLDLHKSSKNTRQQQIFDRPGKDNPTQSSNKKIKNFPQPLSSPTILKQDQAILRTKK
jgi:hypothetical protein